MQGALLVALKAGGEAAHTNFAGAHGAIQGVILLRLTM